ncbi:MAG: cell wall-binding repeat-containing protein, partial [Actinomycetia bacterium]|nr:cell wall-binding repeat-containing protein [Actinomycetes bacterium]
MKKYFILVLAFLMLMAIASVVSADILEEIEGCCCHSTLYTHRIGGDDRVETAIEISKFLMPEINGKETDLIATSMGIAQVPFDRTVIICRSDDYPDALAAAGLAGQIPGLMRAPILLNNSSTLDPRVEDELDRLYGGFDDLGEGDVIFLIGGEGALSSSIEDDLEDFGFRVERLGGANRYETATLIADEIDDINEIDGIFICTGENWPDALAAAAFACWNGDWPILLVQQDNIPGPTLDWLLANKEHDAYVIGGPGVISSDVMSDLGFYLDGDVERVYGDNRYETCIALAEHPDLWNMPPTDEPDTD